jgi:hypothetical protein
MNEFLVELPDDLRLTVSSELGVALLHLRSCVLARLDPQTPQLRTSFIREP